MGDATDNPLGKLASAGVVECETRQEAEAIRERTAYPDCFVVEPTEAGRWTVSYMDPRDVGSADPLNSGYEGDGSG